jgi:hypothetical protein
VLDFGLAKALEPATPGSPGVALTNSPTITQRGAVTSAGVLLGTAAYMAPEQARGRNVDKRADMWAFGVIVFEMVAGKPLFAADTVTDTLAAVVSRTPDWSEVPPRLHPLLRAALDPDPKRRLRDMGDAFRLLDVVTPPRGSRASRRTVTGVAIGSVMLAAIVLAIVGWMRPVATPAPILRLQLTLPAGAQPELGMALSPDGQRLAFVPVYRADMVAGGQPVRVKSGGQIGADWNQDGTLVFGTNPGRSGGGNIYRMPISGSEPG